MEESYSIKLQKILSEAFLKAGVPEAEIKAEKLINASRGCYRGPTMNFEGFCKDLLRHDKISQIIMGIVTWAETKQGHIYWMSLYEKVINWEQEQEQEVDPLFKNM